MGREEIARQEEKNSKEVCEGRGGETRGKGRYGELVKVGTREPAE